jgi:hypothetical protein
MHFALVGGLVLAGVAVIVLVRVQGRPLVDQPNVGIVLAGLAIGLLIVAVAVLRRRIPERRFDQSPDAFWASAETRGVSILLWAVVDGAGLVSWVGYAFTGGMAPAAAAVLSILTLIVFRPARLEREGGT